MRMTLTICIFPTSEIALQRLEQMKKNSKDRKARKSIRSYSDNRLSAVVL